jgi:hypothetical protein
MSSYAFSYYGADTVDSAESNPAGTRDRGLRQAISTGASAACKSNGELVTARPSVIGILYLIVRARLWR